MDLEFDPGRLFGISDEPVGGFQLIVAAGLGVDLGGNALQGLREPACAPDKSGSSAYSPDNEECGDRRRAERNEQVEDFEKNGKQQRDRERRRDFADNPVPSYSTFDCLQ